jgi:hypothetical protein
MGERPTTISRTESEQQLKEKETKLLADDKAKEFTTKHQAWIHETADRKAKDLTKEISDLIEGEEKPEQKAEQKTEEKQEDKSEPEETEKADEPNTTKVEP